MRVTRPAGAPARDPGAERRGFHGRMRAAHRIHAGKSPDFASDPRAGLVDNQGSP